MDLLITNARVWDDRPPVDIGIEGERIAAIEPRIEAEAGRVIDADGRAVLPGFVEPHLHLDKALLYRRQPARDGTLAEAIRLTGQLKAEQDRDDVLERSRAVLDMAVAHGTVAIRAHPDVDPIQGLLGVETALVLREEYRDLLDLEAVAFPQEGIVKAPGTLELMEEALRMGASVVGGCPYNEPSWEDTRRHIDLVFELAQRFDVPVDMHADFADDAGDQRYAAAGYIAEKAIELGWQGRVSLGHVTSLAALTREEAMPVVERLRDAQVTIVTLPATDLYLGGRGDERNQRRGLTPVHLLRDSGVNVTFSSNNVRNAFTPFGKADMLQIGNLLAHTAQFGTPHSQAEVLRMATYDAARSIGLGDYGLAEGRRADLVVLDSPLVADVLADIPPRLWVVKRGRVTVESRHETIIHRTAAVPGA
jgi:cytosine/creatinine deaminase